MPGFSFRDQFVQRIRRGTKRHTIRAKRKTRPRVGQTFYGLTGIRTANCQRIFQSPITKVEDITIDAGVPELRIWIEGVELTRDETEQLARRDGFRDAEQMQKFWRSYHGARPFSGDLIHWDYSKAIFFPAKAKAMAA
jgi:hypothetical protein